jgi:hypothetical protein
VQGLVLASTSDFNVSKVHLILVALICASPVRSRPIDRTLSRIVCIAEARAADHIFAKQICKLEVLRLPLSYGPADTRVCSPSCEKGIVTSSALVRKS